MGDSSVETSTEGISAFFVLFLTILALALVLSKLLHDKPFLNKFGEVGLILLIGITAGFVVNLFFVDDVYTAGDAPTTDDEVNEEDEDGSIALNLLSFSPQIFFVALLPPIIFNSGYHLKRELFFRHLAPVALFAVVGTVVSALFISFLLELVKGFNLTGGFEPTFTELLAFGALISATDPVSTLAVFQAKRVDPHLFYLVFGESVLNDAVGLVLFDAFSKFVVKDNGAGKVVIGMGEFVFGFLFDSIGSPLLGLLCGCGAALLFKHVDMRDSRLQELSVYMLIMYVPFLLAEVLKLSGIVTILFTGMTAQAYVVPNLSDATAENAEILFRLFAHLAETSIFLELGMSVFGLRGSFKGLFTLWALLGCLVGRALNVYPISFLYNLQLQREPKTAEELAEERRLKRRKKSYARADNESHVEMTNNLKTSDHHSHVAPPDDESTSSNGPAGLVLETIPSSPSNADATTSDQMQTPRVRRDLKISYPTAHMMCFSGLRGAVAYACVRAFPDTFDHQNEFTLTTMVIVLATVFVLGGTTEAMLSLLNIEMNVDEEKYMENWHQERRSATILLRLEDIICRNVVRQDSDLELTLEGVSQQSPPCPVESSSHARLSGNYSHVGDTEDRNQNTSPSEPVSPTNVASSASKTRRKTSLFDYGANH